MLVHPGDLVVADGDGVVVVRRDQAAQVVALAQRKMAREAEVATAIRQGATPWDLIGAAQAYDKLSLVEHDAAFDDPPAP